MLYSLNMKVKFCVVYFLFIPFVQACFDTWSLYKGTIEGPYTSSGFRFGVNRTIQFRCNDSKLELQTNRELKNAQIPNYYYYQYSGFGSCTGECSELNVSVTVHYLKKLLLHPFWTSWSTMFSYVNQNCDKLYWFNWVELENCTSSSNAIYTRNCFDCDGELFPFQNVCPGDKIRIEPCQPLWSEWGEAGPCISSTCNSTGQRVRTRKCLYGDGIQAQTTQLCSFHSDIMTEQCQINKTECSRPVNTTTPKHEFVQDKILLIIGPIVGVVILILIIIFIFRFVRHQYFKKQVKSEKTLRNNPNSKRSQPNNTTAITPGSSQQLQQEDPYTFAHDNQCNRLSSTEEINYMNEEYPNIYLNVKFTNDFNGGVLAVNENYNKLKW